MSTNVFNTWNEQQILFAELVKACRNSDSDLVSELLGKDSDLPRLVDDEGRSALYWLCRSAMNSPQQSLRIVDMLIEAKVDVNRADDSWSQSPLYWAAIKSPSPHVNKALHCGRSYPAVPIMKRLIDAKAEVNHANKNGWTALHASCARGSTASAMTLINAGADVKAKTLAGTTRHGLLGKSIVEANEVTSFLVFFFVKCNTSFYFVIQHCNCAFLSGDDTTGSRSTAATRMEHPPDCVGVPSSMDTSNTHGDADIVSQQCRGSCGFIAYDTGAGV